MTPSLETEDLIIDIPAREDGQPLNLRLSPGQVWGVLGHNGAGKTTLLHTLAGLRKPRAGRIRLEGRDLDAYSRRHAARRIGIVFQEHHDEFPATVLETALIGRHPYLSPWEMESAEDVRKAAAALERLSIADLEHRGTGTLSGGERQRAAIATVLAQSPDIWLADEPTNHLDLRHQTDVMALLAEQAGAGRTVMMCLHDPNLAARWCDHLLFLYPGGRHRHGRAEDLLLPELLEELYGQPLDCAEIDGRPVFVAASARY